MNAPVHRFTGPSATSAAAASASTCAARCRNTGTPAPRTFSQMPTIYPAHCAPYQSMSRSVTIVSDSAATAPRP